MTGNGLAACVWVSALGAWLSACAGGNPQPGPTLPQYAAPTEDELRPSTTPAALAPPAASATPPASSASAEQAEPLSVLHQVSAVALQIVPGNPALLVGDRQAYEWREAGIIARPRLLADAFNQQDLDQQTGFPAHVQGTYPDHLYVQVMRARASEPTYRRRFLKWSKDRWQKLAGPLGDSPGAVVIVEPERGMLAVGCVSERCFFQPVSGKPLVPRFAGQAGCTTRMSSVLDAELDASGTLRVLGNECSTGRVLLESWPKGKAKSSVEVLSTVTPRPEGFEPVDIGLGIFDGEAWVWGVEWFWGGGPVTQSLLLQRAGGAWPLPAPASREQPPCDESPVSAFSIWRGYQVAVCNKLLIRPPGADWTVAKTVASHQLQVVDGRLLLRDADGLWQFDPPDVKDDAATLSFALPCPGHYLDLGIDKDIARARQLIEPLGDLRKEMVLATIWNQNRIFLIAPDQQAAVAAANTLKLQNEPECLRDEFQTFITAD